MNYFKIKILLRIWAPPVSQVSLDQNQDAFVYSVFEWRRYLLAHNVCALYDPLPISWSTLMMSKTEDRSVALAIA